MCSKFVFKFSSINTRLKSIVLKKEDALSHGKAFNRKSNALSESWNLNFTMSHNKELSRGVPQFVIYDSRDYFPLNHAKHFSLKPAYLFHLYREIHSFYSKMKSFWRKIFHHKNSQLKCLLKRKI